ncbi:MAG: glycerol-3-phosphate dehydrogenase/oxidase [Desulfobacterales bacterium]
MNRDRVIDQIVDRSDPWDIIVIGGGATGLGTAVEAASRGYATLLLEQHDFGKGTSSRSTKLIHGGVRYLQQGNLSLVVEALHERELLLRNAPHLVHHQAFIVPTYEWWEGPFYGVGLKLYDVLAGKLGFGSSKILSRDETLAEIPTLEPDGLRGGVIYYDGQFDDARLAITLAHTIIDLGQYAANYFSVTSLTKHNGLIQGVIATDGETGREYELHARAVINATGPFVDSVRQMDDEHAPDIIAPSQGIHIVLDKSFEPGESAIMVPHTDDGRILFAVPWHNRVIVGTTDTPIEQSTPEPEPLPEEIDFLLSHAAKYLTKNPEPRDILSVFAGIRPLIKAESDRHTATISRDHHLNISPSGLITIAGGKWTTYRKMGEDTVDQAITVGSLEKRPSQTQDLRLHGWSDISEPDQTFAIYGTDATALAALGLRKRKWTEKIHPDLPYTAVEVIWAVRHEMARTLEDVLARRTRALILDARASMAAAPKVASLMAKELGKGRSWRKQQVDAYVNLAKRYLPPEER